MGYVSKDIKNIVKEILEEKKDIGGIKNIYFVGCGGSLGALYPAKTFMERESQVLRSAWIPAPPLQSLPAMDNAVFMKNLLCMNFIARQKVVPPICRGLLQPPLAAAPS